MMEPVDDLGAAVAGSSQAAEEIQRRELDDALTQLKLDHPEAEVRAQPVEHSPMAALAEHCLREASCPVVVIPVRTVPEPEKAAATAAPEGSYHPGPHPAVLSTPRPHH